MGHMLYKPQNVLSHNDTRAATMAAFSVPTQDPPALEERPRDGLVTVNVKVDPYDLKNRRDPHGAVRRTRRLGNADDTALIDILPNEMLFTNTDAALPAGGMAGGISGGEYRVSGFSSFNGIDAGGAADTQRKFERRFRFLGFARQKYEVSNPYQPQNGVACQIRGALTIFNNGTMVIRPRDRLRWRLRYIDDAARLADDRALAETKVRGLPPQKYIGIIEPDTPDDDHVDLLEEAWQCISGWLADDGHFTTPHSYPTPAATHDAVQTFALAMWRVAGLVAAMYTTESTGVLGVGVARAAVLKALGPLFYPVLSADDKAQVDHGTTPHTRQLMSTALLQALGAFSAVEEDRRSHIIGYATTAAGPGDPVDIVI